MIHLPEVTLADTLRLGDDSTEAKFCYDCSSKLGAKMYRLASHQQLGVRMGPKVSQVQRCSNH